MKLPSIPYLASVFVAVLRRFPWVMLSAAIGVVAAIMLIENILEKYDADHAKMLMTAALGIPLFLCAAIATEKWQLQGPKKWLPVLGVIALLLIYYFTLNIGKNEPGVATMIRFAGFILAAHLLVAYLPYLDRSPVDDFWEYNKQLFANFVVGAFYSLVIFAGLSIAILAVDQLFDLDINDDIYGELFVLIAGIFNTAFFLANFPQRFAFTQTSTYPEQEYSMPNPYMAPIINLTKFILIPIICIYFLILYAYSIKILATWKLPQGWVGSLVLGFSVAGIFTYLLNYLLVKFDHSFLVKSYRKWFFIVLLPMVVLLFVAIGRRISDYGITEDRFVVAIAGVWLLLISLYFIISGKDNIKFIPISLSVIALLSVLGPFSAFRVSERSQVTRLESILTQNNMLQNGKAVAAKDSLSSADAESVRSILNYLREYEHFGKVASWFGLPSNENPDWAKLDKIISDLNIGYAVASSRECYANFPAATAIDLDGFGQMFRVYANEGMATDTLSGFCLTNDRLGLDLYEKGKKLDSFNFQPYLQKIAGKYDCTKDQFIQEDAVDLLSGAVYDLKIITENMAFEKEEAFRFRHWNGTILLRRKQ